MLCISPSPATHHNILPIIEYVEIVFYMVDQINEDKQDSLRDSLFFYWFYKNYHGFQHTLKLINMTSDCDESPQTSR